MAYLPANGTTVTAEKLHNQFVCAAILGSETVINGSAVQTIGQSVPQLLVATHRSAVGADRTCTLAHASAALMTAMVA